MIAEEATEQQTENKNQNKEKSMATEMKIRRMSDVQLREVAWLWKPYIPFGKITIIQGDPGEGKTTLALRVAVACSTGTALPGMEACAPFDVIYQTAEDGLGDTVKPRLIEAGADESRILNIVEDNKSLSLLDERIEKAIVQTGAKLMILDPMQGYLGDKTEKYTVPEGTQTGTNFTVKGKGIPDINSKRKGDLIITVLVETPKNLTSEQKKLLQEFSKSLGEGNTGKKNSFFKKLFNK